jgi:Holliday junction DNA helicase RuvA
VLKAETLAVAIAENDVETITRAPGVGRRTAERIILDLKSKIQEDFVQLLGKRIDQPGTGQQAVIQALVALGYSRQEAGQAVSSEGEQNLSVEERVRRALQRIGQ